MAKTQAPPPKPTKSPGKKAHGGVRGVTEVRARGNYTNSAATAELIDVNKPLTDMQKQFVKFWAEGDSITSASLRAGYSDGATFAYRMVRMPNILALKAEYEAKYQEAAQMTRKKVMDMHLEAFEMAKLMSEPATMVSAAREVGKMCGYYAPVEVKMRVDSTGSQVVDRLNNLTDAELLKIITSGELTELPAP